MSRPTALVVGAVLAAFITGGGFGLYLGGSSSPARPAPTQDAPARPAAASPETSPARESSDVLLRFHAADLEKQLADLKKNQDALILADRLAFYKKYSDKNGNPMGISAFGDDLKVTPVMADFLKMSDEEKKKVEQHMADAQAATRNLEEAKLKLVKQEGNSMTYEIPAYPEGKMLEDNLKKSLEADLGEERAGVLWAGSKWQFNQSFSNFGEGKTEIQITRTDQNGAPNYRLRESFQGMGNGVSSMERDIGGSLPARYANLLQIDPTP